MIWSSQLVFDCVDPDPIMRFWGLALEYPNRFVFDGSGWGAPAEVVRSFRDEHPEYDGRGRIDDEERRRVPIFIQRVPESKQGPNRLRPELAVRATHLEEQERRLADLGATASETGEYRDVEGNEFTLVGDLDRSDVAIWLRSIVIDCLDPASMVAFWSAALGYPPAGFRCDPVAGAARVADGEIVVHGQRIGPAGEDSEQPPHGEILDLLPGLSFNAVTEAKRIKNRLHLDLNSTDAQAEVDRLCDLGATVVRQADNFVTLQDPESNEFCVQ